MKWERGLGAVLCEVCLRQQAADEIA
jgi:hypothetical protein